MARWTPLEQHVARSLREARLAEAGRLLLVAVSGGFDSTALLAALVALRDELQLRLHVIHVDHGLRAQAGADAAYVRRLGLRWKVPVTVRRVDVEEQRRRYRISLEEAARQKRYAAMSDTAREIGAEAVLVAHTADDQVETVLLNLLRGTGLHGLSGMSVVAPLPPVPDVPSPPPIPLLRPLMAVSRSDVEDYLRTRRLRPRQDASNLTPDFLRNRVRHELIPMMEALRPGARDAVQRAAAAVREAMDYLESQTATALGHVLVRQEDGAVHLALTPFRALHSALRLTVLQRAIDLLMGSREGFGYRHWDAMASLPLEGVSGDSLDLPHEVVMTMLPHQAVLSRGPLPCPLPPLDAHAVAVAMPGETRVGGWTFRAFSTGDGVPALVAEMGEVSQDVPPSLSGPLAVTLPQGAPRRLEVRPRQPGDRMQLPGGSRKLQDILTDAHVPRGWRDRVPIVYDADSTAILWIVGVATGVGVQAYSPNAKKVSTITI